MPPIQSDKMLQANAANRGCLSARQIADVRKIARVARSESVSLTVHGVTVGPTSEILRLQDAAVTTAMHHGRKSQPAEPASDACEKPSNQLRKRAQRLADFNEAKRAAACGARWLPLVKSLLRRAHAKLRGSVVFGHMRTRLTLRAKMSCLLHRVLTHAQQNARSAPDDSWLAPWPALPQPSSVHKLTAQPPQEIFTTESFSGDEAFYDAEDYSAESPPVDRGANRADYHTPPSGRAPARVPVKKSGRKTRSGRSTKPLQPANRG